MNTHVLRIVKSIEDIFDQYLQKKIGLLELQRFLGACYSNFENDVPVDLQQKIYALIEKLEYIQFMYNKDEYFGVLLPEIEKVKDLLSVYSKE